MIRVGGTDYAAISAPNEGGGKKRKTKRKGGRRGETRQLLRLRTFSDEAAQRSSRTLASIYKLAGGQKRESRTCRYRGKGSSNYSYSQLNAPCGKATLLIIPVNKTFRLKSRLICLSKIIKRASFLF
jgi:hypothetical protein